MIVLYLLPVWISLLLVAAHFLRAGNIILVIGTVASMLLVFVPRRWAARGIQCILILAAVEWLRTFAQLAGARLDAGRPVLRLALILGIVVTVTLASGLVFRTRRLRAVYRLAVAGESPITSRNESGTHAASSGRSS